MKKFTADVGGSLARESRAESKWWISTPVLWLLWGGSETGGEGQDARLTRHIMGCLRCYVGEGWNRWVKGGGGELWFESGLFHMFFSCFSLSHLSSADLGFRAACTESCAERYEVNIPCRNTPKCFPLAIFLLCSPVWEHDQKLKYLLSKIDTLQTFCQEQGRRSQKAETQTASMVQ